MNRKTWADKQINVRPGDLVGSPDRVPVRVCIRCGAVVFDAPGHEEWHLKQDTPRAVITAGPYLSEEESARHRRIADTANRHEITFRRSDGNVGCACDWLGRNHGEHLSDEIMKNEGENSGVQG